MSAELAMIARALPELRPGESRRGSGTSETVAKSLHGLSGRAPGRSAGQATSDAPLAGVDAKFLCACGCGQSVNPLLGPALALRKKQVIFRVIGERLGVSGAYVRALVRKPPKYVKGHSGKAADWITVVCDGCGETFRTTTTSGRTYCKRRHCKSSRLDHEAYDQFIRRLDEREEHDRRIKHASFVRERHGWRPPKTWEFGERFADLATREREEIMREAVRQEQLASLVAEQEREMRWCDYEPKRPWISRLDDPIRSNAKPQHDFGGTWKDLLLDHRNTDPAVLHDDAEQAEALHAVLGDLQIENVARLNEHTIDHLRERLREEGLTPRGVQRKERERLAEPARHRGGYAPSPMRGRKSGSHKRSRDASQLMKGKRPSRKPKRRWTRDDFLEELEAAA